MEDILTEEDAQSTLNVERFMEKCDAQIQTIKSSAMLDVNMLPDLHI